MSFPDTDAGDSGHCHSIRAGGWRSFAFALAVLSSVGCRFTDNAFHTAVLEPIQYPSYFHDKVSRIHYRKVAYDALEHERAQARAEADEYDCEPFSPAHEQGFIDGFVDYLYAGGTGEPPPLPPRKFWNSHFQNPDGYQATIDWFHGFKHGSSAAQSSGLRQYVTIPTSDSVTLSTTPYAHGTTSFPAMFEHVAPTVEQLPARQTPVPSAARRTDRSAYPLYLSRLPPVSDSTEEGNEK